jgi:hypothetical protein
LSGGSKTPTTTLTTMDDFASDTDSDYTSYWRDWVSLFYFSSMILLCLLVLVGGFWWGVVWIGGGWA